MWQHAHIATFKTEYDLRDMWQHAHLTTFKAEALLCGPFGSQERFEMVRPVAAGNASENRNGCNSA